MVLKREIKTDLGVLLSGAVGEVERRLGGTEQLVGQVHVDVWISRKQKEKRVWRQPQAVPSAGGNFPRRWILRLTGNQ